MKTPTDNPTPISDPPCSHAWALPRSGRHQALAVAILLAALIAWAPTAAAQADPQLARAEAGSAADDAHPDERPRNILRLGPDGLPEPQRQLPDLGRLHTRLMQEAKIESYLEATDRRHLAAVRAYVERTGRLPDLTIHDHARHFEDSRRTVQQLAKEALRDYVKDRVGWEAMQDRMKVRIKNVFHRGGSGAAAGAGTPATGSPRARSPRAESAFGAFEVGPEVRLDLDDSELGLGFGYDGARTSLLSRWELYLGQRVESGEQRLRLRYTDDRAQRWLEVSAGSGDEWMGGYVAFSVTALF